METQLDVRQRAVSVEPAYRSLDIGRTAFYALVRAGKIRVIKLGKRTLVPVSELDRVIAEGLAKADQAVTK